MSDVFQSHDMEPLLGLGSLGYDFTWVRGYLGVLKWPILATTEGGGRGFHMSALVCEGSTF